VSPTKELEQAEEIIRRAFESNSQRERIDLARKALQICADCTEAYLILAEEASSSLKHRIEMLQEGVKAGRRTLGPIYFKENVGSFWLFLETRPYMRALFAFAEALYEDGQMDASIEHYYELLRLNTNDNLGVRYTLIPALVSHRRFKEARELIEKYKDDIGVWIPYSRALLHFKQRGNTKTARQALQKAIQINQHVLRFLFLPEFLSRSAMPESYSPGSIEEAYLYAAEWRPDWEKTRGALNWVLNCLIDSYLNDTNFDADLHDDS
jgi:tetratricopeptide (TPR) repeat protein